jgi:hypothetical protein
MLFLGLPAFILIQMAWCCTLNRCGFNTAGVLALVGAIIVLALAIVLQDILNNCESYYGNSSYYEDDYWDYDPCDDKDEATSWMNLSFASAILWAMTGILVLDFVCGGRYQDFEDQLRAEGAEGAAANQVAIATAVTEHPMAVNTALMRQAPVAGTRTTTNTNRPDGSVEKKTEVTNPDGSKTVTVVVLKPTFDV